MKHKNFNRLASHLYFFKVRKILYTTKSSGEVPGRTKLRTDRNVQLQDNKRDQILADYKDIAESAMLCLDEGFESAMTVMALPAGLRRFCRTSNHIERLNRELKRRSSVLGIFPNEESLVRTMAQS